jgi:hypothetical protein
MRGSEHEHSIQKFSQQLLIALKPFFDFPNRPNTHKQMQGPKAFCCQNLRLLFSMEVTSPESPHLAWHNDISQISWQSLTLLKLCFVFSDLLEMHKHLQGQKIFSCVNPICVFELVFTDMEFTFLFLLGLGSC